jgi:hypothetical protein
MKNFKDIQGRTWTIEINVRQVKFVRDVLRVDLYKAMADEFKVYNQIVGDPVLLVDLLYCLCKSQADSLRVSDEDFGRAMRGDVVMEALDAFGEELIAFFPGPAQRAMLTSTMQKAKQVMAGLLAAAATAIDQVDPEQILEALKAPSPSETPGPIQR